MSGQPENVSIAKNEYKQSGSIECKPCVGEPFVEAHFGLEGFGHSTVTVSMLLMMVGYDE